MFWRTIQLSSPRINNLILCGCLLIYSSIFLTKPNSEYASIACKVGGISAKAEICSYARKHFRSP